MGNPVVQQPYIHLDGMLAAAEIESERTPPSQQTSAKATELGRVLLGQAAIPSRPARRCSAQTVRRRP